MLPDILKIKEKIDRKVGRLVVLSIIGVFAVFSGILYLINVPRPEMDLYTVTNRDLEITITETGEIKALNNYEIRLPYANRGRYGYGMGGSSSQASIVYLIPEGTRAEPGDTLLRLDTSGLLTQREGLVEQLLTVEQALDDEILNQETQKRQDGRALEDISFTLAARRLEVELAQFGSINQKQQRKLQLKMSILDSMKLTTKVGSDRVLRALRMAKAEKRVRDAQQRIRELDQKIESYTMTTDNNALVVYAEDFRTQEKIGIGDTPYPGQNLLLLPDLTTIAAVLQVSDLDRANIWLGQEAKVSLEAYQDMLFHGTVSNFTPISQNSQFDTYSNVKVFEVLIKLDGTDDHFKPGLSATVNLVIEKVTDVPAIPLSAVMEFEDKLYVYVSDNGNLKLQEVELGKRNAILAEVKQGVKAGDEILKQKPIFTGNKIGRFKEQIRENMAIEMLDEHFDTMEELGIQYDYDRNRGRTEGPRRGGQFYQSRSMRMPTYEEISQYLEKESKEDNQENRNQAREFLMRTQNAGRDTVLQRLERGLREGGGRRGGFEGGQRGRREGFEGMNRGRRGGARPDSSRVRG